MKFKEERKTSDSEEDLISHLSESNFSAHLPELGSAHDVLSVCGFEANLQLYEPESQWLERLEEEWERKKDLEYIFGDD